MEMSNIHDEEKTPKTSDTVLVLVLVCPVLCQAHVSAAEALWCNGSRVGLLVKCSDAKVVGSSPTGVDLY